MQFVAPPESYDRFMGRYVPTLAIALADAAGVRSGMRVVDVGCGPGGLTRELAARVGAANVAAIDPAPQFAAACRARNPGADVREGVAEELPWPDGTFDAALASLVIGFMRDPDAGVAEMERVTRPGGTVAACMWDTAGGRHDDAAGSSGPRCGASTRATRANAGWPAPPKATSRPASNAPGWSTWSPASSPPARTTRTSTTSGNRSRSRSGPAGQHLKAMDPEKQVDVSEACRAALPDGPFSLDARAWYASGRVAAS